MTAWGNSEFGTVDIYYLGDWGVMNLDGLIDRAVAAVPTASMTDTGETIQLIAPNLFLMYAGDSTTDTAYGVLTVPCDPGTYRILSGRYREHSGGDVTIYRLIVIEEGET